VALWHLDSACICNLLQMIKHIVNIFPFDKLFKLSCDEVCEDFVGSKEYSSNGLLIIGVAVKLFFD
jgi:hypothetical protein